MSGSVENAQKFHDVAAFADLENGKIQSFSIEGQSLILVRDGETVHALEGKCPHKNAPMEQGAFCHTETGEGVVVCPWHKAVFDVADGRLREPVALDPLQYFPVIVREGRVKVSLKAAERETPQKLNGDEHVLILGAGAAGVTAAVTLRQEGFAGTITMVTEEKDLPYDRTALSKTVLLSDDASARAPVLREEDYYKTHDINVVHAKLRSFDPATKMAVLANDVELFGDHVLIATGSLPRHLGIPGEDLEGVFALHRERDAELIAAKVKDDQAVTIVGAGFVGLEVASLLRQRGVGVTIVTPSEIPLERHLGREIGLRLRQLHEDNGVAFVTDAHVVEIYGKGRAEGIKLSDGMRLPAAFILMGAGVVPAAETIEGLDRDSEGAIVVDQAMEAAPGVYAAGDVSALRYEGKTYRIEHWRHAQAQGRQAALSMLGQGGRLPVPWFWTQQFGKKIEVLGWGEAFDSVRLVGDIKGFHFLATYMQGDRPVALAGAGHAAELARAAVDFEGFLKADAQN
ncbi:rubredoxin-NAD reductase [Neokomagataea thailandica NBRC 106555]|uniref:Rubredoxin-NAD(+) reductase n=2 Tax=Neokomagataea TaxID=1223423 RepID=A0A4Y6VAI5_9PROT|nr:MULTISPECIES: FAD-dependent oxidoreductase [Neokomagataea]QDH25365.1 rubredoxin-NAD(+) reductase [Neokomagataea tanensis]GBR52551.1 rubredoxin-NAD reductase [Neokomagataea thailandica NBRC 106555]